MVGLQGWREAAYVVAQGLATAEEYDGALAGMREELADPQRPIPLPFYCAVRRKSTYQSSRSGSSGVSRTAPSSVSANRYARALGRAVTMRCSRSPT